MFQKPKFAAIAFGLAIGASGAAHAAWQPVKPIEFTQSTRGNRYLRASLDSWLSSLDPNAQTAPVARRRIGERVGG